MTENTPAPVNLSQLDKLGIKIHDTRLEIPPDLSAFKVSQVAHGIFQFGRRWQWYFLDCYLDVRHKEGREAASQLLDGMGYSNGYLHNIISYGSRVAYEARSLDIDFTKYESIAQLPREEQPAMVERVKGDPDMGDPEMPRDQLRTEVGDRLNELYATETGKTTAGKGVVEEDPPQPIYEDCKRCKNCPDCQGTHRVRVM